ncbi:ATP-dependent DNA helicase RecG [Alkaliphilus pronyensis]|uniref:ATP-dependent DNA helicase RecG n=1 Tax=Alkaliphilus pronyensis TaxID=1482732 RepID=A0A6I0FG53_9FIRM|nr:ATP-dependent DNA helicase RecG [Alkaliphilus pronyensis]KAB3535221.1 ATP-dependent DNA helicase RecG [Alkaliphilus pronyensis]
MDILKQNIQFLKGVGPKTAERLIKLNISTPLDLLYHFPRDYDDRRRIKKINQLVAGDKVTIIGEIIGQGRLIKNRRRLTVLQFALKDDTGRIFITFFNMPYLRNQLKAGSKIMVNGEAKRGLNGFEMINPTYSQIDTDEDVKINRIVPIYPATEGLKQNQLLAMQSYVLELSSNNIEDHIPEELRKKNRLCNLDFALKHIHFPLNEKQLKVSKYRLVFDEFFLLQLGLAGIKKNIARFKNGIPLKKKGYLQLLDALPFKLTSSQMRTLNEILEDIQRPTPMNRLVQGDVGSGKTIIAILALYICVLNGYQGVMMAPTEILAEQHYQSLTQLLSQFNIRVGLLIGSLTKQQKTTLLKDIANGSVDIVVGTHAIIQEAVDFKQLALAITDEQHRFGVRQRTALVNKGVDPHLLVMTATPIPRTLALILYGDLDISIIDELPPGRKDIKTVEIKEDKKGRAYDFVKKQLDEGRQAYIVCPLVEESEAIEAHSATETAEELKNTVFTNYRVGLLHGKMKAREKEAVMTSFKNGEIDILVSTTVIEVGVNVPNATIMLIENSERYGLAQLHQLRGRVGRGSHQSYCILVHDCKSEIAKERVKIMVETNNGFVISEKDLALRGPGEFFGIRQHGLPELKIADIFKHVKILKAVEKQVAELLREDPDLTLEKYPILKKALEEKFEQFYEEVGFS